MTDLPVLLIAWRRPETTAHVLHALSRVQPSSMFVALDGPLAGEERLCRNVRDVVGRLVDWPCDLKTLYREENLGCKRGVSEAIDWFFSHVDRGVILEDDTVPEATFFPYVDELLTRYSSCDAIGMISGANLLGEWPSGGADYFFGHGGIWGWATWRDRWAAFDVTMRCWGDDEARESARQFLGEADWKVNQRLFDRVARGAIDTWDYQWSFARASRGLLSVIPTRNLIRNVGFGVGATHTQWRSSPFARLRTWPVGSPLRHPPDLAFDRGYQAAVRRLEHPSPLRKVARRAAGMAQRSSPTA